ncbi:MAG: hypothetical protein A2X32_06860 [Elusimicrobia bacterium GWC2_64_44]|nr:MAG: hypothetical protein A2X32_06860 [Elusimicrobia bacterium GWC2_64_44]
MTKSLLLTMFSVLSFCAPSFARPFSLDSVRAGEVASAELPVMPQAAVPAQAEPKEWTIIYYSTTKDFKLRPSFLIQMLDLKLAGSSGKVNVVVEGSVVAQAEDGSISTPTLRMAIGGEPWSLEKAVTVFNEGMDLKTRFVKESALREFSGDIVSRETGVDTGDWRHVAEFARWAKANYPAKRYAFLIFGHGNGIVDAKKTAEKGTLADEDTKNYVTIPEMRLMMAEIGKVDVFLMQSCLMQMAEVVWQVKDYTDVVVGSSEFLWSNGFFTPALLKALNENPQFPSLAVGDLMAESYVATLPQDKTGHVSVIPTAALPRFAEKLDAWADAVMKADGRDAAMKARHKTVRFDSFGLVTLSTAQSVNYSISGDLYDFVRLTTENIPRETEEQLKAAEAGRALMEDIEKSLVYKYYYKGATVTGFDYSVPRGIAIHVPPRKILTGSVDGMYSQIMQTNYWDLPFARETRWGAFLNWIYRGK